MQKLKKVDVNMWKQKNFKTGIGVGVIAISAAFGFGNEIQAQAFRACPSCMLLHGAAPSVTPVFKDGLMNVADVVNGGSLNPGQFGGVPIVIPAEMQPSQSVGLPDLPYDFSQQPGLFRQQSFIRYNNEAETQRMTEQFKKIFSRS